MSYQYRWWYVVLINFIVLLCNGIYYINPLINELKQIKQSQKIIIAKIQRLKRQQTHKNELIERQENNRKSCIAWEIKLLSYLTEINFQSAVSIRSVDFNPTADLLHLSLEGSYDNLTSLLIKILNYSCTLLISDFSYQLNEKSHLLLNIDLFVARQSPTIHSLHQSPIQPAASPFCAAAHTGRARMIFA